MSTRTVLAREAIDRLCGGTLTAKALREQVLAEIRRIVPFDAHAWLLTDPVTRVGTSPLADIPGLRWPDLPRLGRARYLTRINRWTDMIEAGTPVDTLMSATGGSRDASLLWREFQQPLGAIDVAALVFWDRFGCWAWLDLWRYHPAPAFDADEIGFLATLTGPVTAGLRRAQARTFVAGPATAAGGPAVLVLGPDLEVRSLTPVAAETLSRLNPPDEPMTAIPAAAYNVAAALIAAESGMPVGPPWSRVHLGAGRWLTLRAARLGPSDGITADITVSIEASTPSERQEVFALAHGLTPRERQVLDGLAAGLDSRAMAQRLSVSEYTVHDHVKAVLAKTGSATRQTLLSRIAGTG
ncbi:helix-turn-helix transcriptional regulator [Nocardia tengchongensis]|uniref:helix-turn-helix transcriptional regulator n=1 Tax=Nocardia tengchongensis TaxID=2055889 RepID=UPI0036ACA7EC